MKPCLIGAACVATVVAIIAIPGLLCVLIFLGLFVVVPILLSQSPAERAWEVAVRMKMLKIQQLRRQNDKARATLVGLTEQEAKVWQEAHRRQRLLDQQEAKLTRRSP